MSNPKKAKIPVFDMLMSNHFGAALGAEALFGIKIKDKLAWPPEQIDGDDTVARCPELDYVRMNHCEDLNDEIPYGVIDPYPVISPTHPEVMTAQREEYINEPELFGGDTEGSGGVTGLFTWLPGKMDQVLPDFITSRLGVDKDKCPSFRGLASAFFCGARKPGDKLDPNGIKVSGRLFKLIRASKNAGFRWGTNDPYVPSASLRIFRRPKAEPMRQFAEYYRNPNNVASGYYRGEQHQVLVIKTPFSPARKKPDGDDGEKLKQGGGFPTANPASVIYELVSSGSYEISATEDAIDKESFLICARRLAFEKMGISFAWVEQETVKEVVSEICKHVGAAVFIHPKTGLYTMRLLRPESDIDAIEGKGYQSIEKIPRPWITGYKISPSNATLDGDIERKSWADVVNSLTVKYTNDETSEENSITVQNQIAIAASGGRINDATMNGYMFRSEKVAQAAAERELGNVSQPLMRGSWILDRSAWKLAPFDVVEVDWPTEGLVGTKFRIMSVDYGTPKDRSVRIDAVEDIFGKIKPRIAYNPQPPLWSPDSRPTIRQPYYTFASAPMLIANGVSKDELDLLDEEQDSVSVHMVSSETRVDSADAFVRLVGESFPQSSSPIEALPRALMGTKLGAESTSIIDFYGLDFGPQERDPEEGDLLVIVRTRPDKTSLNRWFTTISGGRQSGLAYSEGYGTVFSPLKLHWGVGTAALALDPDGDRINSLRGIAPAFHEEVCMITAVDQETGETTIQRGLWDTVPAPIAEDAWVFHVKNRPPVPRQSTPSGDLVYSVYRPKNATAVARETTQPYSHVPLARQSMPARPGNVRLTVGSDTFGIGSKVMLDEAAPITVKWSTRNRLFDDAIPAKWTAGNITPEVGQSQYVRVWRRVRRQADGDAPAVLVAQYYNLGGDQLVLDQTVFEDSMTNLEWNPGEVETDIVHGASFVIEVGSMRMTSGSTIEDGTAQMSAQAALMLVDIGTAPGGYGNRYGEDYGGAQ